MATTGTVLAKNMAMYLTGSETLITCQTNALISMSTNMFETTCKDSGAWAEPRPGTKSWTASGEGNVAFDATYGIEELHALWYNQTEVAVLFQTGTSGDTGFSGSGYISSLEVTSNGNDEAVTFSYQIDGAGALIQLTVS